MNITQKKLSELHKTEKNIRKHSQKQIEEYVRSLKMFGQIRPLVVTEDGEILAGNGMYDALASMGAETCDVYVVSGLSDVQKKKLMLADNKVYDLGLNDANMFQEVIRELEGDFDVPGWDADLLKILTSVEEDLGKEVTNYGVAEATEDVPVESPEPAYEHKDYEPVIRDNQTGEILNPQRGKIDAEPQKEERPFVICPKCGEKIWL